MPGSRAAADLVADVDVETSTGDTHLAYAHRVIVTAIRAGADHHRAFADGVLGQRTTVSNWTLARGALEGYARAHYLLNAGDAGDLLVRHVGLILSELKYSKVSTYATRDGARFDPDHALLRMLVERALPAATVPSMTNLTTALLDDTAPGAEGRRRYSQLSSAAHGESIGVQMFMPMEGGSISLPKVLVEEAAHAVTACSLNLGDELAAYFGTNVPAGKRWIRGRNATVTVLLRLAQQQRSD